MPKFVLLFLLAIFAANFLGISQGWYWTVSEYDTFMHLTGGAWTALFFLYVFTIRTGTPKENKSIFAVAIFALGFTALIGVLWEFYEYLTDILIVKKHFFLEQQESVADTMKDLFSDLLGSAAVIFFFVARRVKKP